jgi:hypothetical protein
MRTTLGTLDPGLHGTAEQGLSWGWSPGLAHTSVST